VNSAAFPIDAGGGDLKDRVWRLKEADAVLQSLPDSGCGLCGAPSCAALARDVAGGEALASDRLPLAQERSQELSRGHPRSA
jgi:Na+-translocating ferredoxin:NAD+ oxidoreductase RNF subunit RnfB